MLDGLGLFIIENALLLRIWRRAQRIVKCLAISTTVLREKKTIFIGFYLKSLWMAHANGRINIYSVRSDFSKCITRNKRNIVNDIFLLIPYA